MRARVLSVILAASAAACAPSAPAAAPEPRTAGLDVAVPPVRALLGERERLSLTSEQVVALDSIAREWDRANDKLARGGGGAKPAGLVTLALKAGKAATRPRTAVAENNLRAAKAVERVLTPEQRRTVCELTGGGAGDRVDAPAGSRSLVSSSAPRRAKARRVWPWCAAPSGEPTATHQSES